MGHTAGCLVYNVSGKVLVSTTVHTTGRKQVCFFANTGKPSLVGTFTTHLTALIELLTALFDIKVSVNKQVYLPNP